MADRPSVSLILLPSILYGGVLSAATDCSIYFFYSPSLSASHALLYFWGHTFCMTAWCLIAYPKLLWTWTCGSFMYPQSNWKLPINMAILFSFGTSILHTILIGYCIQKFTIDTYFTERLLYTPASAMTTLYCLEFTGINEMVRDILLHRL